MAQPNTGGTRGVVVADDCLDGVVCRWSAPFVCPVLEAFFGVLSYSACQGRHFFRILSVPSIYYRKEIAARTELHRGRVTYVVGRAFSDRTLSGFSEETIGGGRCDVLSDLVEMRDSPVGSCTVQLGPIEVYRPSRMQCPMQYSW